MTVRRDASSVTNVLVLLRLVTQHYPHFVIPQESLHECTQRRFQRDNLCKYNLFYPFFVILEESQNPNSRNESQD